MVKVSVFLYAHIFSNVLLLWNIFTTRTITDDDLDALCKNLPSCLKVILGRLVAAQQKTVFTSVCVSKFQCKLKRGEDSKKGVRIFRFLYRINSRISGSLVNSKTDTKLATIFKHTNYYELFFV